MGLASYTQYKRRGAQAVGINICVSFIALENELDDWNVTSFSN